MDLWPVVAVAGFGLCVGSFLNVCILRLPLEQSIVRPRSHCPHCRSLIAWYDNIPLLSFCLLGARCRSCRHAISWRYPLVELLTAGLSVATYGHFPALLPYLCYFCGLVAPLIAVTFIDLDHQIIPDVISLPGILVGIIVRVVLAPPGAFVGELTDGAIGAVAGGGTLWIIATAYEKLKKHEGLGGGDVKLAAMLGAFLGWKALCFVLLVSSLLGSIVGLLIIIILKKGLRYAIPFGPFLAVAGLLSLFFGDVIVDWYLGLFTL